MPEAFLLSSVQKIVEAEPLRSTDSYQILSELGGRVFTEAVSVSAIEVNRIENVVWGGELPKRDNDIPGIQVIRPDLSGLQALYYARQSITSGDLHIAAAGGAGISSPVQDHGERANMDFLGIGHSGTEYNAYSHNFRQIKYGAAVVILASTQIIGSLNLIPSARLAGFVQGRLDIQSNHTDIGILVNKALVKVEVPLEDIELISVDPTWARLISPWLIDSGVDPVRINPDQGEAQFSHHGEAAGLIQLCQLLKILEQQKKHWGLILQLGPKRDGMAIIIERV